MSAHIFAAILTATLLAPITPPAHADVTLTSSALVLGPTGFSLLPAGAVDASTRYLDALGFGGDVDTLWLPNQGGYDSYTDGIDRLVAVVEQAYADDPADELWLLGYSQSATIITEAEPILYEAGIPADYLRIVLLGDPTNPTGGFWGWLYDTLPDWLHPVLDWFMDVTGYSALVGATAPTDLYQTDIYTVDGDWWADWSQGMPDLLWGNLAHASYWGVDPDLFEVTDTDGLLTYHDLALDHDELIQAALGAWEAIS